MFCVCGRSEDAEDGREAGRSDRVMISSIIEPQKWDELLVKGSEICWVFNDVSFGLSEQMLASNKVCVEGKEGGGCSR